MRNNSKFEKYRKIIAAGITIICDLILAGWLIFYFTQLTAGNMSFRPFW